MTGGPETARVTCAAAPGWPESDDAGSATIWMLVLATLIVTMTSVAVDRRAAVLARHRLESAADLSALAGADQIGAALDPCVAAVRVARENGATVQRCSVVLEPSGRSGAVRVELSRPLRLALIGTQTLVARARAGRLEAPGS